ncbi:MAG TPA: hypothetical protein VFO79_05505 [Xanthomonadales bacterium]|nr:hypothetical protein [Xanthomonadales bacterium]
MLEALRQWFAIMQRADRGRVAMPSRAVDEAWHEFIVDTPRYVEFCTRAFGRYVHHRPAEPMRDADESKAQLRVCWRLACENAGIDPRAPQRLPKLFAIDRELDFPRGFRYRIAALAAAAAAAVATGDAAQGAGDGGVSVEFDAESIGCGSDGGGGGGGGDGCGGGCGGGD